MEFLKMLAAIRNPVLDTVMLFITKLGEETVFLLISMFILWCVDKYEGYYLMFVGFAGIQINQILKVNFRIERPWVKDPSFSAVKGALKGAAGYSFPSGHAQSSVGTFLSLAIWNKNKVLRVICILLCILVPFSRLYLGVHTPTDVLVSVGCAVLFSFAFFPIAKSVRNNPNGMRILFTVMLLWSIGQVLFMKFFPFPQSADAEQILSGLKSACKMLGAVTAVFAVYELDLRYIKFKTEAVLWVQIIKLLLGVSLALAVKKSVFWLSAIVIGDIAAGAVSYFFVVIFAGAVWPLTFKFFGKIGAKKSDSADS